MTNTSSATFHQFQQQLLGRVSLHITFSHHMFIYQAFHFHFEHVSFSMFHIVRSSPNRHITTWIQLSPDTSIIFIFHISMCHRYELVRCIYPGHIYWPLTNQCLSFLQQWAYGGGTDFDSNIALLWHRVGYLYLLYRNEYCCPATHFCFLFIFCAERHIWHIRKC